MTIAHPVRQRHRAGDRRRRQPQVHLGRRVAHQDRREGQGVRRRRQRLPDRRPGHRPGAAQDQPCRNLPHVKAAIGRAGSDEPRDGLDGPRRNAQVLTSVATIETLGWNVFVEQPVAEVYAKLNASIVRTGLLLLAGLVISALGALALARGMVRPIRTLDEGARRIGAGDLDQKIDVHTGDELEGARRPVQPDDGAAARVVRGPRAQGRRAHARAAELARAADGDQRDPARDLELADRRAAGAAMPSPSARRTCAMRRSRASCWSRATMLSPVADTPDDGSAGHDDADRAAGSAHADRRSSAAPCSTARRSTSPTSLPLLDTRVSRTREPNHGAARVPRGAGGAADARRRRLWSDLPLPPRARPLLARTRSRWSRPSRARRRSPSTTCGCSTRRRRRSTSRPRSAKCCA